jgi:hypothetical protein
MAGLAQSMSGGGMGGLIPMAFRRGDKDRPQTIASGSWNPGPVTLEDIRKRVGANASTIATANADRYGAGG